MESPLWTERHAPAIEDLRQDLARDQFERAVDDPVNLLVHGPPGVGKTAATRAMAREAHEQPDSDLIEINVADFFARTKTEVKNDDRFASFLQGKSDYSKRDMINHVLKESASYAPVTGEYKTVLLDNAEGIREDFQQALRRVMEQYHRNTQFVIATRQPSKLIPPLRSRCFAVPMPAPDTDEVADVLEEVAVAEDVEYERDGLEFVAGSANGDLREAILSAQTTAESEGEITMNAAFEALEDVGLDDRITEMLDAAEAGEFTDARSELDDLLVDEGLSGREILEEVLSVGRSRYDGDRLAELHELAGDVDLDLTEGSNDRIQLGHFLAELGRPDEAQTAAD
ncbi:replication factor C small subunit 2 [Salinarchaeum sp. Harcht-Bsk1]|uniref:AAA family ATPase n=1 Tax=Salinarchaeum sp. Harcht-Bsk1 TaxID=1333523 RepID=UPI0003422E50|nr:AAA family ATPase [Salinarchaeum sp. Harcht-Bsk1]AGN00498.1 replication factor C small subunit 2 [Salinarchaeum sp. Harcht-Bsk1]